MRACALLEQAAKCSLIGMVSGELLVTLPLRTAGHLKIGARGRVEHTKKETFLTFYFALVEKKRPRSAKLQHAVACICPNSPNRDSPCCTRTTIPFLPLPKNTPSLLHPPPHSFSSRETTATTTTPTSRPAHTRATMPLFKKKPPPQWYVLRPKKYTSSASEPTREGPYTRATITQMYGEGTLGDGALLWTNEKIFPNAQKPTSMRPVRIMEWRRLDQLPDPVVRQLAADWQHAHAQQTPPPQVPQEHPVDADDAAESSDSVPPTSPPPPPPPPPPGSGDAPVAQPYAYPAPSSIYPAPAHHPPPHQHAPTNHPQMTAFPQAGAYPAPSAPPPPSAGAY